MGKMVDKKRILTMIQERRIDACRKPEALRVLTRLYDDVTALPDETPEAVHAHWEIVEYEYLTCSNCDKSYYTDCNSTAEAKEMLKEYISTARTAVR
jgi:hypothetical protein